MKLPDVQATEHAGAELAALLTGGDTIALVGELGAGKTTFVAGLVAALGGDAVHSPTFSLVHEYRGGKLTVWHVDLYRIERAAELPELGLDDVIGSPRGIVVVEWADKFSVLPADHLRIELSHVADNEGRELRATGTGPRSVVLASALSDTAAADSVG